MIDFVAILEFLRLTLWVAMKIMLYHIAQLCIFWGHLFHIKGVLMNNFNNLEKWTVWHHWMLFWVGCKVGKLAAEVYRFKYYAQFLIYAHYLYKFHIVNFTMIWQTLYFSKWTCPSVFLFSILGMGAGPSELGKSAREKWKLGKVEMSLKP